MRENSAQLIERQTAIVKWYYLNTNAVPHVLKLRLGGFKAIAACPETMYAGVAVASRDLRLGKRLETRGWLGGVGEERRKRSALYTWLNSVAQ